MPPPWGADPEPPEPEPPELVVAVVLVEAPELEGPPELFGPPALFGPPDFTTDADFTPDFPPEGTWPLGTAPPLTAGAADGLLPPPLLLGVCVGDEPALLGAAVPELPPEDEVGDDAEVGPAAAAVAGCTAEALPGWENA